MKQNVLRPVVLVTHVAQKGGVAHAFLNQIELLQEAGYTPIALVGDKFPFKDQLGNAGIHFHTHPSLTGRSLLSTWIASHIIGKWTTHYKANTVILHNSRFIPTLSKRRSLHCIGVVHGGQLKRFLKADYLLTVNTSQRQDLIKLGFNPEKVNIFPNAIDTDSIDQPHKKTVSQQKINLGVLAALEPAKGVADAIHALHLLQPEYPEARLLIGGEGSEKENLQALCEKLNLTEKVEFIGWIEDKAEFFANIDMLLVPSHAESFGLVILEAMCHHTPVIATKCEGPRDIIEHLKSGVLVERKTPSSLAQAISMLIQKPTTAKMIAQQAMTTVKQYDKVQISKKLSEILDKIDNNLIA